MDFNQLIAEQDGIVTVKQAAEFGVSRGTLARRAKAGELHRMAPGVYRSAQHSASHAARLRAVVLRAGTDAVASGPSAAWWYGVIDDAPSRCWVTIPPNRRALLNSAHNVRRRTIKPEYLTTLRRLPVTVLPLAVLEAAVAIEAGSTMMDRALQTKVSLAALKAAHDDNIGRAGSAAAGELLAVAETGGRSEAERLFHRLLQSGQITGWIAQFPIAGYVVDVAFPDRRVVVEIDGWAFHRDAQRHSADLRRQNEIQNRGWRVLRFDWHRLMDEPDAVLQEVRKTLR